MIDIGVSPVAFEIGSISVRWYGIFIALAVLWLIFWMWLQIRKGAKISTDTMLSMALVGIPSGIIFARLLHVLDNIVIARLHPEYVLSGQIIDYLSEPGKIIGGDGLTAYGAILGASLGIWIYCKVTRIKIGYVFDLLAPGVMIAQAVIGRIGCTLNGCCYGTHTSLPWGIQYTNPASLGWGAGVVHPTTVYEILFGLIAFVVLIKLRGRLRPDGSLYAVYLSLYALWRIGIDFIRDGMPFLFGLHQAQVVSIILLLIAVIWMIKNMRWGKKEELLQPNLVGSPEVLNIPESERKEEVEVSDKKDE
jgi:phosphatidylglycerol:prolipoprotein diacylglycerol transferase